MKKYEIINGRCVALKNFGNVKKGDVGGYIDSEENLSQYGKCWVFNNASVTGEGFVKEDALVMDSAVVKDKAIVAGRAKICHNSIISGRAFVRDDAFVTDVSVIRGEANVFGKAYIGGSALVEGEAIVEDYAAVRENAYVGGKAWVCGLAEINKDGIIKERKDYVCIGQVGSFRTVTIYKSTGGFMVRVGCSTYTPDGFKEAVDRKYSGGGDYYPVIKFMDEWIQCKTKGVSDGR